MNQNRVNIEVKEELQIQVHAEFRIEERPSLLKQLLSSQFVKELLKGILIAVIIEIFRYIWTKLLEIVKALKKITLNNYKIRGTFRAEEAS